MSDIFNEVTKIISEQLDIPVDEITLESDFVQDLGADSLDLTELVMTMEDKFDLEIDDDATLGMKTVKDTVLFIESCQPQTV
ncbi:MAG: acyl carrier protein [Candidatus Moraniibacteriota bacterium]